MDKQKLKYQIFDLTPDKFEELCHLLLKAEFSFDKAFILDISADEGLDILAYKGIEKIAISVKHKYHLEKTILRQELKKLNQQLEYYHKIIFVTSAFVDKQIINELETNKISIISQNEFISLLDKHSNITQRYFETIERKNRAKSLRLTISLIATLFSILSLLFAILQEKPDRTLTTRIDNVEKALNNIKGLEKYLDDIKEDMIKTDQENKRILEEYKKMKGIEKEINEKKETLSIILNYKPWYKKFYDYFFGFLFGIASSYIASILWDKWKLKNSLKN